MAPQDAGGVASARSSPLPPNVVRPGVHGASGNGAPTVPDPGPYDPHHFAIRRSDDVPPDGVTVRSNPLVDRLRYSRTVAPTIIGLTVNQWIALLGFTAIVGTCLLVYAVTTKQPRVRTRDRRRGHHRR